MANKHTRKEHISVRRKREEAVKEQNRKKLTKQQKTRLTALIGAAALVVILLLAFVKPAGAVLTWFGTPMFISENDVVGKIGNYYYDLGDWNYDLEGYTLDPSYAISRDKNRFEAYYASDAEDNAIFSVYVGVVPENTAEEMYDKVTPWVTEASELADYADAPVPTKYFETLSHFGEEEGMAQRSVVIYLETPYDAMIHISINSDTVLETQLPTAEELMAVVPAVLANLTIAQ